MRYTNIVYLKEYRLMFIIMLYIATIIHKSWKNISPKMLRVINYKRSRIRCVFYLEITLLRANVTDASIQLERHVYRISMYRMRDTDHQLVYVRTNIHTYLHRHTYACAHASMRYLLCKLLHNSIA